MLKNRIANQKGFGHAEIIVILVVIGIIAAIGFVVVNKLKPSGPDKTANATATTEDKSSKKSEKSGEQFNWSGSPQGPYHDKIAYATSTDLLNWTDSGKTISEHTSVPDVMVKDGVIYMYFVDVNTNDKPEQIGLKTSSDKGATWSATTIVTGLGDETAVDPDPFLLPDGRIRLYYYVTRSRDPNDTSKHSIYSAISKDGKTFTKESGVRFQKEQIVDPDVIKVGSTWRMYVGQSGKILSATSTDGLSFTYEGIAAQGGVPNAYYDGTRYLMFSAGINIGTSTDGKTYTALANGQFKAFPGADPGVVKLGTNSYLMVYKINTGQNTRNDPPVN
jgi:hypothetical protein